MAGVTITDKDLGMRAVMRMLDGLKVSAPRVVVGITGEGGRASHKTREDVAATRKHARAVKRARKKGKAEPPAPVASTAPAATVVEIGAVHEFGAGRIPARSFLRSTFDAQRPKYQKFLTNGLRREVVAVAKTGQTGPENLTLKRLGLVVEGDIKKRIADGIAPPLSPATIARKKSSKPLIDTGQLRASIASEIRRRGGT